jgi:hypothetical protein
VRLYHRLLALIVSLVVVGGMSSSRANAAAGEARLNFQGLPDGPAPANFGPGPALLTTAPSGNAATQLRVVGGKLTNKPTLSGRAAGYYTSASLGAPIRTIGARWTFTRQGGTLGAMALLISQTALHFPFSVHLVITPEQWSFGVWPPDGATPDGLQTLQTQSFDVPLEQDGNQVYETRVEINGERVDIDLPDGQHQTLTDHRIAEWAGSFATFETYADHGVTDTRVGFTEIWAHS